MRRRRVLILALSAFSLITICIRRACSAEYSPKRVRKLWRLKMGRGRRTLSRHREQRQVAAELTRSASFDQKFQKLSEKARKKGTVPVIVKVRAAFRPEGRLLSAAERLAQRKVIEESQDQLLAGLRYEPSSLKRFNVCFLTLR